MLKKKKFLSLIWQWFVLKFSNSFSLLVLWLMFSTCSSLVQVFIEPLQMVKYFKHTKERSIVCFMWMVWWIQRFAKVLWTIWKRWDTGVENTTTEFKISNQKIRFNERKVVIEKAIELTSTSVQNWDADWFGKQIVYMRIYHFEIDMK